jgi:hypothetical protein
MNSRTKLYLLALGLFSVIGLCYLLAFSKTINLRNEYRKLSKEVSYYNHTSNEIYQLNAKRSFYDSILDNMNLNHTTLENNLLRVLNQESQIHNLKVIDFNEPHKFSEENSLLNTHIFTVQGNFNDILNVIYKLELQGNFGSIIHLKYSKKKDYKLNKDFLTATIFIQNLK